jgi:para-aminobenzoate synthetase component 1
MKLSITELPYLSDTTDLLENLQNLGGICALESAAYGHDEGQWSVICAQPYKTVTTGLSDFDCLEAEHLLNTLPCVTSLLPFTGGIIGHATYGTSYKGVAPSNITLSLYTWAYLLDHKNKKGYLVYWSEISVISLDALMKIYGSTCTSKSYFKVTDAFTSIWNKKQYKSKIDRIHQYIISGDVYQVNLAQKFTASYAGSSLAAYGKLKAQSNSPFLTYFELGNQAVASASPELFIRVEGNHVSTKPIKGTVGRSKNKDIDEMNIDWLKQSKKDHAENLMITDLLRNDLSINCQEIKVPKLFNIESFETVHHLVSTVTAEKNDETSPFKIFIDAFPGGSITGAPKKRAIEIISELEEGLRSFYCGSTFYYSTNKNFSSNILIRSFAFEAGKISCWAGGGITIDSTWESEYNESLDKISKLMLTLEQ